MSTTDKIAPLVASTVEAHGMVQGFAYKLNAMERAAQEPNPADFGFGEKREAVLDCVRGMAAQIVAARATLQLAINAAHERERELAAAAGIEYDDDRECWWVPADPGPIDCDTLDEALVRVIRLKCPECIEREKEAGRLAEAIKRVKLCRESNTYIAVPGWVEEERCSGVPTAALDLVIAAAEMAVAAPVSAPVEVQP